MNAHELLLRESDLFSLSFSDHAVGFKAVVENEYPFYVPNFFLNNMRNSEDERKKDFEETLRIFIVKYLSEWFNYMKTAKEGVKNEVEFLLKLGAISSEISKSEIFSEVVLGKKAATLNVPANKSTFSIKRIGDCLGIKLEGEHKGGLAALEALRAKDDSMFRPQILFKSISSWIPLLGEREKSGNGRIIDFSQVIEQLRISLPEINLQMKGEIIDGIIEIYIEGGQEDFCIGNYCGLPIYARITHGECFDKTNIRSVNYFRNDVKIWRSGNVHNLQHLEYSFKDAEELSLVLSIKNSLPSIYSRDFIDENFKNNTEQWNLRRVAAMVNAQLRCMLMRSFMRS